MNVINNLHSVTVWTRKMNKIFAELFYYWSILKWADFLLTKKKTENVYQINVDNIVADKRKLANLRCSVMEKKSISKISGLLLSMFYRYAS